MTATKPKIWRLQRYPFLALALLVVAAVAIGRTRGDSASQEGLSKSKIGQEGDHEAVIEVPDREFTLEELRRFDGSEPALPILLALKGTVFDVSAGADKFYGKGKAYSKFAGRDITRCTAMFSTEEVDLDRTDFPPEKLKYLEKVYEGTYKKKYVMVGYIINPTESPPEETESSSRVTFEGLAKSEWRGVISLENGKEKTYYWNPRTNEVRWDKPPEFDGSWVTQAYGVLSGGTAWVYKSLGWSKELQDAKEL